MGFGERMKASLEKRAGAAVTTVAGVSVAVIAVAVGSAAVMWPMTIAAFATPATDLPGRWSGFGNITMAGGSSEQMRCVATYFVDGASIKQNLRCASAGYKIDATANLTVSKGQVTGDWEEKIWSTTGSVTGRMVDNGFNLAIAGPGFTAALALSMTTCKQTITITPKAYEIASIAMTLGKC